MLKSREDLIKEFRQAFKSLSDKDKVTEVERLVRVTQHKPIFVLEDVDIGKTLKFKSMPKLIEYFWREKHIRANRSFLYKVLKREYDAAYGYHLYYFYEEE